MNAVTVLNAASAAGVHIEIDGCDLVFQADVPPPPEIVSALMCHKAEIITLLQPAVAKGDKDYWQKFYSERVRIAETDTLQSRAKAEAYAFECCLIDWMNRHCAASEPSKCAGCDQCNVPEHVVVPFGTSLSGHTWLHPECWQKWQKKRRLTAVRSLLIHGIVSPANGNGGQRP